CNSAASAIYVTSNGALTFDPWQRRQKYTGRMQQRLLFVAPGHELLKDVVRIPAHIAVGKDDARPVGRPNGVVDEPATERETAQHGSCEILQPHLTDRRQARTDPHRERLPVGRYGIRVLKARPGGR